MADIPTDVGYLTIVVDAIEALADSNDMGNRPDALPMEGTVILSTDGIADARPFVVAVDDLKIIQLRSITCLLTGGQLYPPDDGSDGSADDDVSLPTPGVELVAPIQGAIDKNGWTWKATFKPPTGVRWRQFTISGITGAPGDTINLATVALFQAATSISAVAPTVWTQSGTAIPAGAVVGQYIFDTDTDNLYLIGA